MSPKPWVLVADGCDPNDQSRTTLWTVRALGIAGYPATVAVSSRHSAAEASRFCRDRVIVPPATAPSFAEAIHGELRRKDYLTVLPTGDAALLALGAPVDHLLDKSRLLPLARDVGLEVPPTEVFETSGELIAAAPRLRYPVVAKPALGRPARRYDGSAALIAALDGAPQRFLIQPYLDGGLWSIAGVMWHGRLVAAVHQRFLRTWPPDAGMACAAVTIEPDLEVEARLVELLGGYEGVFEVDLVGRYLLDVNPRVYASISLAVASGVNLVSVYCDLLRGRDVPVTRARPGVRFRWLEGDLRFVADRLWKKKMTVSEAARILRPRRDTAPGGSEWLADPKPLLARARYLLTRLQERASDGA